jgi:hypothetical protein
MKIKPPPQLCYDEAMALAVQVASAAGKSPLVEAVLLFGSVAEAVRDPGRRDRLFGDVDLIFIGLAWGGYELKCRASASIYGPPITKAQRFHWVRWAIAKHDLTWSPLDAYDQEHRSDLWVPNPEFQTEPLIPILDVAVLPADWQNRAVEVAKVLSGGYHSEVDTYEFLETVALQAVAFDPSLRLFVVNTRTGTT